MRKSTTEICIAQKKKGGEGEVNVFKHRHEFFCSLHHEKKIQKSDGSAFVGYLTSHKNPKQELK